MYALVDCNNFYASCERLFQPRLRGKPIVVLSNNDGCVIARSDEAKALGVVMGAPAHMHTAFFQKHQVEVFSSNYTLYGDMSDRVMKTLSTFVAAMEIYSIDEAFLDLRDRPFEDLAALGSRIRDTVMMNTGIPVSVGIAPTKALAKMANRFAKKKCPNIGVYHADTVAEQEEMLRATDIGDVWGIGHQHSLRLRTQGIQTAADFLALPQTWVRANMSVVGLRLWNELCGRSTLELEEAQPNKQHICTSRSFGKLTRDRGIIEEAVSNHAATCARKLREQRSVCKAVNVFISTNPHKTDQPQYRNSITIECDVPTSNSGAIIRLAKHALGLIFREGSYLYMKCGVTVLNLGSEDVVQQSLFANNTQPLKGNALRMMDKLNKTMGRDKIRMATQGFDRRYRMRADRLSQRYTTRLEEVLKINN